jgi:plasmid stability protein
MRPTWCGLLQRPHQLQRKLEPPEPLSSTTTLTISNVVARLKERLRLRAVRHGRSMEAELRDTLRRTLANEGTRETNLAERVKSRAFGNQPSDGRPVVRLAEVVCARSNTCAVCTKLDLGGEPVRASSLHLLCDAAFRLRLGVADTTSASSSNPALPGCCLSWTFPP